jgi:ATP-dependent protease Clp ATPase subunit
MSTFNLKRGPVLDQIADDNKVTVQTPSKLRDIIDLYVIGITVNKNVLATSVANNMRIQLYMGLHATKSLFKGLDYIAQMKIPGKHPAIKFTDKYIRGLVISNVTKFLAWTSNRIYEIA